MMAADKSKDSENYVGHFANKYIDCDKDNNEEVVNVKVSKRLLDAKNNARFVNIISTRQMVVESLGRTLQKTGKFVYDNAKDVQYAVFIGRMAPNTVEFPNFDVASTLDDPAGTHQIAIESYVDTGTYEEACKNLYSLVYMMSVAVSDYAKAALHDSKLSPKDASLIPTMTSYAYDKGLASSLSNEDRKKLLSLSPEEERAALKKARELIAEVEKEALDD